MKHYFPAYRVPGIITYIATFDAPGVIVTDSYIGVGLHQAAGKRFPGYQIKQVVDVYPTFHDALIRPMCPPTASKRWWMICSRSIFGQTLVEQMIEKRQTVVVVALFMPEMADSLKTRYTQQQLNWCTENEGLIWSWIVKTRDINTTNPITINNYIGPAPFTQNFSPELSPATLGQWIGRQIVREGMQTTIEAETGGTS